MRSLLTVLIFLAMLLPVGCVIVDVEVPPDMPSGADIVVIATWSYGSEAGETLAGGVAAAIPGAVAAETPGDTGAEVIAAIVTPDEVAGDPPPED